MPIFISIILLSLVTVCAAAPVDVKGARIIEIADRTQLVFDISAPVKHASFTLDNPPRLVVDLSEARLHPSLQGLRLHSADVRAVRTGVRASTDLRIVFDMAALAPNAAYLVPPDGKDGHRLVVEIYRSGITDMGLDQANIAKDFPISLVSLGQPSVNTAPIHPQFRVVSIPQEIVVAIDPGHGGKDPGAIGPGGTREKDVVLAIGKRLQTLVDREPGMRAVMTRDSDIYLSLYERISIARSHQADLFVSIHADAFTNTEARGSSVFILSTKGASSEAARWLADRENAADLIGGVKLNKEDDFINTVLFDIYQDATLESSMNLAEKVLGQLRKVGDVHKNRVERAGFAVLRAPDIPSVLVETAFISNPEEEKKLRSERHQQRLAEAIMDGVRAYFHNRPLPQQQIMVEATPVEQASLSIPEQVQEAKQIHIIQRGESLAEIAQRYQVSLPELRSLNGLNSNQLRMPAGTALTIPFSGG